MDKCRHLSRMQQSINTLAGQQPQARTGIASPFLPAIPAGVPNEADELPEQQEIAASSRGICFFPPVKAPPPPPPPPPPPVSTAFADQLGMAYSQHSQISFARVEWKSNFSMESAMPPVEDSALDREDETASSQTQSHDLSISPELAGLQYCGYCQSSTAANGRSWRTAAFFAFKHEVLNVSFRLEQRWWQLRRIQLASSQWRQSILKFSDMAGKNSTR